MANKKITVDALKNMYASGERNFENIDLSNLNLKGIDLRRANLSNSCLDNSNLEQADLRESILDRTSLKAVVLIKANLNEASLVQVNLERAKIVGANLRKANLCGANLTSVFFTISHLEEAKLDNACLHLADLNGAYFNRASFIGADLRDMILTNKSRLKGAYYDTLTLFDPGFNPLHVGMKLTAEAAKITIKELLSRLNSLSQYANQYLGQTMTVKYWQSSRPHHDWLQEFNIDHSAHITFSGEGTELITTEQLESIQQWSQNFIECCSQIIQDFSTLVEQG